MKLENPQIISTLCQATISTGWQQSIINTYNSLRPSSTVLLALSIVLSGHQKCSHYLFIEKIFFSISMLFRAFSPSPFFVLRYPFSVLRYPFSAITTLTSSLATTPHLQHTNFCSYSTQNIVITILPIV